jgi:uncharacterized coiled-coil DUF342 family protein
MSGPTHDEIAQAHVRLAVAKHRAEEAWNAVLSAGLAHDAARDELRQAQRQVADVARRLNESLAGAA